MTPRQNKMSESAWAVRRERTTNLIEYIGFRLSWSPKRGIDITLGCVSSNYTQNEGYTNATGLVPSRARFVSPPADSDKAGRIRRLKTWNLFGFTFAWNHIGVNNVFRLCWDMCG